MAKIGLLYLQQGRWRERQVVSEAYVLDSTHKHSDGGEPANAGYGYLWWTKPIRDGSPAYFAAGWQSQLILNLPNRNLVMALASSCRAPAPASGPTGIARRLSPRAWQVFPPSTQWLAVRWSAGPETLRQ